MKCNICGRMLTGDKKKGTYTYYKHECPGADHQTYIPESKIFEMMDDTIRDLRYSPDFAENLKNLAKKILGERSASNRKRKLGIAEAIENLEARRDKALDLWFEDEIDRKVLKRTLNKLSSERDILSQRHKLTYDDYDQIIYEVCDLIDELRDSPIGFLSASYEDKVKLLYLMSDGALISGEVVQLLWKEPYSFLLTNDILKFKGLYETEKGKKNRLSDISNSLSKLPVMDETLTVAMNIAITDYEFYYVRQKSA